MSDSSLFQWSRALPQNQEAEKALLGALMANNRAFDRVSGFLKPHHFYDPVNGKIYQAIINRITAGQLADAVTLKNDFDNSATLADVGGTAYFADLLSSMVAIEPAGEYGRAIHEAWLRREMIAIGNRLVGNAYGADLELDAESMLYGAQDELSQLNDDAAVTQNAPRMTTLGEAVNSATERAQAIYRGDLPPALSTGFRHLDTLLSGGFYPATLNYLAGLGETGKTQLALQIAEHVAATVKARWEQHRMGPCPGVLFFSFDMTAQQLGVRSAARLGGIANRAIRNGELTEDVCMRLVRAQAQADALPIEIDTGEAQLGRITANVAAFARRRPCALVIVDNLSKIIGDGKNKEGMFPAYLSATASLKKLANRLNIPTLLLVHLPQTVAKRDEQKPRRGDLPYGIHIHADQAIGLWRPEFALPEPQHNGRESDEVFAKRKHTLWLRKQSVVDVSELVPLKVREDDGDTRDVKLKWDRCTQRFIDPGDELL